MNWIVTIGKQEEIILGKHILLEKHHGPTWEITLTPYTDINGRDALPTNIVYVRAIYQYIGPMPGGFIYKYMGVKVV